MRISFQKILYSPTTFSISNISFQKILSVIHDFFNFQNMLKKKKFHPFTHDFYIFFPILIFFLFKRFQILEWKTSAEVGRTDPNSKPVIKFIIGLK